MRRGRSWSGGGGGGNRERFRGGGAGYGQRPRGFFAPGPPRLNRPPWPHSSGPPLNSHPGGQTSNFYDDQGPSDNFSHRNFQTNPQRGFRHGPPGFQRQRGNRAGNQRNPNMVQMDKPPPLLSVPLGSINSHQGGPPLLHPSASFEQGSTDFSHPPIDSNCGRGELPTDFNNQKDGSGSNSEFQRVKAKFHQVLDRDITSENCSKPFKQTESGFSHFDDFSNRNPASMLQRLQTDYRPELPFQPNMSGFNKRPLNTYRLDQRQHPPVDFSRPPPFTGMIQDYTSDESIPEKSRNIEVWSTKPPGYGQPPGDFAGQRPPATDHYTDTGAVDDSFHKSINDTVDIIKKRLQDRQENPALHRRSFDAEETHWNERDSPEKKERSPRSNSRKHKGSHRRSKSEKKCARMKKKIVRELFKMDKSALNKFVDDPQSSAKFEFALNSLIVESRNSLNRQMRAAAEKSLSGSSSRMDRREKDDTVYEDTFMAQMQGVLDPQDIIMLSDIKPMVMAEINKVLQLDEYGNLPYSEDDDQYHSRRHCDSYDSSDPLEVPIDNAPINVDEESWEEGMYVSDEEKKKLRLQSYESRHRKPELQSEESKLLDDDSRSKFPDNLDNISDDEYTFAELDKQYHVAVEYNMIEQARSSPSHQARNSPCHQEPVPLEQEKKESNLGMCVSKSVTISPVPIIPFDEKKDLRSTDLHESVLKIGTTEDVLKDNTCDTVSSKQTTEEKSKSASKKKAPKIAEKTEETCTSKDLLKTSKSQVTVEKKDVDKQKQSLDYAQTNVSDNKPPKESDGLNVDRSSKTSANVAHKREADDKISHRKEKRKKTDPKSETNKKVLNKNIIINVNDCASKNSEKCEAGAKSVFNLFFSKSDKEDLREDSKRTDAVNISYSDKYVKRKHIDKTEKDKKTDAKKILPNTQSKTPTKDSVSSCQQPIKTENVKLQPIDMFEQTPRKSGVHLAVRNTAITSPESKPTEADLNATKTTNPIIVKKGNMKMVKMSKALITCSTQTFIKQVTRSTQMKKVITKSVCCQTALSGDNTSQLKLNKSEDVMERMKQIDLEIQELLQEKFKLYKNLENGDTEENSMQSLGMAIVNMNTSLGAENTVDDSGLLDTFTNMSEEELQEIALQGINDTSLEVDVETQRSTQKTKKASMVKKNSCIGKKKKKNVPKVVLKLNKSCHRSSSESHDEYKVIKSPKKHKKVTFFDDKVHKKEPKQRKASKPGISLIDQIINDDRELDLDLHNVEAPIKPKKTYTKKKVKKLTTKELENLKGTVRECSVVLTRVSLHDALLEQQSNEVIHCDQSNVTSQVLIDSVEPECSQSFPIESDIVDLSPLEDMSLTDFSGVHLHEDMLDVSEDIVIDGVGVGTGSVVTEPECDVVDNGPAQEPAETPSPAEGCKLYDFSPNGELGTEMVPLHGHADAIVAIETVNDDILAASLDGNVYHYSGRDGRLLATLRGSNFALTCLTVVTEKYGTTVYTGCLDSRIRYYDLDTGLEKGPECNVLSPIQSMDRAWDTIFVGTRTGFVLQFECKNNLLIPVSSLKFSEQTILALRALKEGPRKVLLIASRSDQVTVKDAQTGLLLRTLEGPKMTVYSLLFEDGKVFCGTNTSQIQVFDFTSGTSVGTHTSGKGAVCLRTSGGLLLAGCYDGCVYIYTQRQTDPIAQLRGPSDMLLSLGLLHSKVIASYKNKSLFIWKLPTNILQEMVL